MGATAAPSDDSEALGQVIRTELLGGGILDVSQAVSGNPSDVGPNVTPLNLTLLEGLTVDLGGGLQLPLISSPAGAGLLDLGELGALNSFAGSPTANTSTASAGAITSDGAIATDINNPGAYGNAKVNLTDVLEQLGVAGITDQVVDNLGLELGAIASTATATGATGTVDVASEYTVADLELNVSSPLVGTVATSVGGVLDGVGDTLNTAVGTGGVLDTVVGAVDLNLGVPAVLQVQVGGGTISIDGLDAAITAATNTLIAEPLADPNGIVSIDLANGLISVDLAKIVNGPAATDLNGLAPNTLVLDDTTISAITSAVSAALGTLTTKVTTVVTDLINNLNVHIALGAQVTALLLNADVDITVDATIGQLTGALPGSPVVAVDGDLLGIPLDGVLNLVTTPVINLLTSTLAPVINTLVTTVTTGLAPAIDGILDPVVAGLSPLFDALNEVVEITINEQPTPGILGAESFTVNAISLELLPGLGALNLDLASSTVRAAEVAAAAIDAAAQVQAGTSLPVTGSGWPANTVVTLQLTDPSNANVGTAVDVTTDANGDFTTAYPVPLGTPAATGYTVTATAGTVTATDTTEVTAGGGGDVNTN
ncbi:MAG TPA: choice-of-anchor G family protein, partial [Microbacterium sp.]|nr:choice-of-anchor G family protein [Microbacterium sp.]